jgi:hypothetical protein
LRGSAEAAESIRIGADPDYGAIAQETSWAGAPVRPKTIASCPCRLPSVRAFLREMPRIIRLSSGSQAGSSPLPTPGSAA